MEDLNLIVLENAKNLGDKVVDGLNEIRNNKTDYRVKIENPRFSNGEAKIKIGSSVREQDVYILADVGNYDMSYKMHGRDTYMGPDEHFSDVKRVIAASANHAKRVSVIMPLLYESRQHKRRGRESLDCAEGLQEINNLGIKNYVTFDAHDPSVANAVPRMAFENFYPTNQILEQIYYDGPEDLIDVMVVSPDMGAMERARHYAELLACDVGLFYKRRDLSRVVDGKNPIVEHTYLGSSMEGKTIIIIDDMIASGGSVIEVAEEAKKRGAKKVIIATTFALFTEGVERFDKAYENGIIDRVYSTNLSYVPMYIQGKEWFKSVDLSMTIARIINSLNKGISLEPIHKEKTDIYARVKRP